MSLYPGKFLGTHRVKQLVDRLEVIPSVLWVEVGLWMVHRHNLAG